MENLQPQKLQLSQEQMLTEIYENTRQTKNYMKWQLIITIALVVIPLLGTVILIPFALRSLESAYSPAGLMDSINGDSAGNSAGNSAVDSAKDIIQKYTK